MKPARYVYRLWCCMVVVLCTAAKLFAFDRVEQVKQQGMDRQPIAVKTRRQPLFAE